MSELTHSSMPDERDAEDKRLLENGEIDLLLADWHDVIVGRCIARMRGPVDRLCTDEASLDFEDESVIVPPEAALRTGVPAVVVLCEVDELVELALAEIERALSRRTAPKSIGVLTMSTREGIDIERRLRATGVEHFFVTDPQKPQNKDEVAEATAPVILSTAYSAKGLEFPMVILCCTPRNGQDLDELRRSIYVGMTRASERLVVLAARDHPLAADLEMAAAQRGRLRLETDLGGSPDSSAEDVSGAADLV